jgi:UDP-glucose 4-epimerase
VSQRILVIGVAGFLGRVITHHFALQGKSVYGVDLALPENAPVHELSGYESLHLPDEQFSELLKDWKPEACLHCGGLASVPRSYSHPADDYQNGPALTFYLLNQLRQFASACSFVLLSSAAVYGNPRSLPVREDDPIDPISVYGYHKWQSEILCREFSMVYGLKTASARIFSAYGVGLRRQVIWDVIYKALTQPELILQGDGSESRDFVHSHDIATALQVMLRSAPMQGESYNVASGVETKISDLAAMIASASQSHPSIRYSGKLPTGTPSNWRADLSRIASIGFSPKTSLQTGIESVVDWCSREVNELQPPI